MHYSHVLAREFQCFRCHVITRPELGRGLRHEPAGIEGFGKTLGELPPADLVGHGEVVALLSAREFLALQNLLEDEDVVFCQV